VPVGGTPCFNGYRFGIDVDAVLSGPAVDDPVSIVVLRVQDVVPATSEDGVVSRPSIDAVKLPAACQAISSLVTP
jgi:hypothetical protein